MIGCIIQARMGSSRLPGKTLMNLVGRPVLWHVLRAVKACEDIDKIVVATTFKKEDDAIEGFCKKNDTCCFRGSETNVLRRFYDCAKDYGFEAIVRITADCPLINPKVVDRAIRLFLRSQADYVSNTIVRSFPKGLDVEVFSFKTLKAAFQEAKSDYDLEHVTPFIYKNPKKFKLKNFLSNKPNPKQRLCIDTMQDFENVERMIKGWFI